MEHEPCTHTIVPEVLDTAGNLFEIVEDSHVDTPTTPITPVEPYQKKHFFQEQKPTVDLLGDGDEWTKLSTLIKYTWSGTEFIQTNN